MNSGSSSTAGILGGALGLMAANPNSPISQFLSGKRSAAQTPASPGTTTTPNPAASLGSLGSLANALGTPTQAATTAAPAATAGATGGAAGTAGATNAATAAAPTAAAGMTSALSKAMPYLALLQVANQAAQNQAPQWAGKGGFAA